MFWIRSITSQSSSYWIMFMRLVGHSSGLNPLKNCPSWKYQESNLQSHGYMLTLGQWGSLYIFPLPPPFHTNIFLSIFCALLKKNILYYVLKISMYQYCCPPKQHYTGCKNWFIWDYALLLSWWLGMWLYQKPHVNVLERKLRPKHISLLLCNF